MEPAKLQATPGDRLRRAGWWYCPIRLGWCRGDDGKVYTKAEALATLPEE